MRLKLPPALGNLTRLSPAAAALCTALAVTPAASAQAEAILTPDTSDQCRNLVATFLDKSVSTRLASNSYQLLAQRMPGVPSYVIRVGKAVSEITQEPIGEIDFNPGTEVKTKAVQGLKKLLAKLEKDLQNCPPEALSQAARILFFGSDGHDDPNNQNNITAEGSQQVIALLTKIKALGFEIISLEKTLQTRDDSKDPEAQAVTDWLKRNTISDPLQAIEIVSDILLSEREDLLRQQLANLQKKLARLNALKAEIASTEEGLGDLGEQQAKLQQLQAALEEHETALAAIKTSTQATHSDIAAINTQLQTLQSEAAADQAQLKALLENMGEMEKLAGDRLGKAATATQELTDVTKAVKEAIDHLTTGQELTETQLDILGTKLNNIKQVTTNGKALLAKAQQQAKNLEALAQAFKITSQNITDATQSIDDSAANINQNIQDLLYIPFKHSYVTGAAAAAGVLGIIALLLRHRRKRKTSISQPPDVVIALPPENHSAQPSAATGTQSDASAQTGEATPPSPDPAPEAEPDHAGKTAEKEETLKKLKELIDAYQQLWEQADQSDIPEPPDFVKQAQAASGAGELTSEPARLATDLGNYLARLQALRDEINSRHDSELDPVERAFLVVTIKEWAAALKTDCKDALDIIENFKGAQFYFGEGFKYRQHDTSSTERFSNGINQYKRMTEATMGESRRALSSAELFITQANDSNTAGSLLLEQAKKIKSELSEYRRTYLKPLKELKEQKIEPWEHELNNRLELLEEAGQGQTEIRWLSLDYLNLQPNGYFHYKEEDQARTSRITAVDRTSGLFFVDNPRTFGTTQNYTYPEDEILEWVPPVSENEGIPVAILTGLSETHETSTNTLGLKSKPLFDLLRFLDKKQ